MKKSIQYILFTIFLTFLSLNYVEAKTCVYSSTSSNIKFKCTSDGSGVSCSSDSLEIEDVSKLKAETVDSCSPIVVLMEYSLIYNKFPSYLYSTMPSTSEKPIIMNGELKTEIFTGVTEEQQQVVETDKNKLNKFNGTSCIYTGMGLRYVCTIKNGEPECVLGADEGVTPTGHMHWLASELVSSLTSSDFINGENFVCPYTEINGYKTLSVCGEKIEENYYTADYYIKSIGKNCTGYGNMFNLAYSPYSKDFEGNEGYNEETKENLIVSPGFESNVKIDFDTSKGCESYLGNPKDSVNKPPAYYLQFTFNLMKYAAIIILLVLTIIEYAKAVASSNQDAIKKATINTVKRLIIAVIIFVLPMLIEFLLKLLGIYSSSTCGIS